MDAVTVALTGFGIIFVFMLTIHLILCFICWVVDFVDDKPWKYWFK